MVEAVRRVVLGADPAPDRFLELRGYRLAGGARKNEAHELGIAVFVRPACARLLLSAHPQQGVCPVGRVVEMSVAGAQVMEESSVCTRVGQSGAHRQELPEGDSRE